jgi:cytochrome c5
MVAASRWFICLLFVNSSRKKSINLVATEQIFDQHLQFPIMKKCLYAFFVLFATACTASKLIAPTQSDADRGSQKFQGYTLSDLNQGKAIYESHCNKCHPYKVPQSRNEAKWDTIIPEMAKKSKLSSTEEDLVLKYVVTMSNGSGHGK